MPKPKSLKLYEFLLSSGVLEHGSEADIALAKQAYRAKYKKEWKQNHPKKEVRITLDKETYSRLSRKAELYGENPTVFAREVIRDSLGKAILIPNRSFLEQAVQELSLGLNTILAADSFQSYREKREFMKNYLTRAENLLIQYLKQK